MPETKRTPAENTADREIVLTRILDAPRELVWQAITNPRNVVNWWGPIGFSITIDEMDVRPGGVWKHTMHGPDGTDYPGKSIFKEVVKPERLVFTHAGGKKDEPAAHFESTWTFEPQGEKTKLTLRMVFESAAARDLNVKTYKSIEGGQQTLARLAEYLPKISPSAAASPEQYELNLTRVLNAPRELVFKVWTDPKHVAQWWGPHGFTNPVCEVDARPGGEMRIQMRAPDGTSYPMSAIFKELVAPERIVFQSAALDPNGNPLFEVLTTVTLADQSGKTKLTLHAKVLTITPAAPQYLAGMKMGWTQSLERLAAHVEKALSIEHR
jgi:uncharacterized protein YndB with AHSA1/START domain